MWILEWFPILIANFGEWKFCPDQRRTVMPFMHCVADASINQRMKTLIQVDKLQRDIVKQEASLTLRGQRGRCRNIKEEPQISGSFPSLRPRPFFPLGVVLWWALANPSCIANLESMASKKSILFIKLRALKYRQFKTASWSLSLVPLNPDLPPESVTVSHIR